MCVIACNATSCNDNISQKEEGEKKMAFILTISVIEYTVRFLLNFVLVFLSNRSILQRHATKVLVLTKWARICSFIRQRKDESVRKNLLPWRENEVSGSNLLKNLERKGKDVQPVCRGDREGRKEV